MIQAPTAVYRLFDTHGRLLYVGISSNLGARWRKHALDKPWWTDVARHTLVWHASRDTALTEEARAIRQEHPLHNIVGVVKVPIRVPRERTLLGVRGCPKVVADAARAKAKEDGTNLSAVVEAYLRRYVAAKPRRKP